MDPWVTRRLWIWRYVLGFDRTQLPPRLPQGAEDDSLKVSAEILDVSDEGELGSVWGLGFRVGDTSQASGRAEPPPDDQVQGGGGDQPGKLGPLQVASSGPSPGREGHGGAPGQLA